MNLLPLSPATCLRRVAAAASVSVQVAGLIQGAFVDGAPPGVPVS